MSVIALVMTLHRPLGAQELDPLSYAASPVGVRFTVVGYLYSSGDVVTDATSALSDVKASINSVLLGGGGTFSAFGRVASAAVVAPYAWASASGLVGDQPGSVKRSGLVDARVRLAISLLGGKALIPREFATRPPSTTLGVSLTTVVPIGQYSAEKLINLGSNRWAFKPEIGLSQPLGRFALELYGGVWLFTRNASFYKDQVKTQDPLLSFQSHVVYKFRPRMWVGLDGTFYAGGRASFDGSPEPVRQENTRVGITASLPVLRTSALKVAWSTGAITRLGGDFDIVTALLQTNFVR